MANPILSQPEFTRFSKAALERLGNLLTFYVEEVPALELRQAMQSVMTTPGKRLRPLLIYTSGHVFHAPSENLDLAAVAVEMIHTYSLIHDDLPCMDNADLRRGQPTCHKQFGEGMAVLTGDALHTLALQILSTHPAPISDEKRLAMISSLTRACGPLGMAAGQALDITIMQDNDLSDSTLLDIYHLKTGALFTACLELGWIASDNDDEKALTTLRTFGKAIGLAFQIQDDIIDATKSSQESGKTQGIDNTNKKTTYVSIHGVPAAKVKVESLYEEALEVINYLGNRAFLLRELAQKMLRREA